MECTLTLLSDLPGTKTVCIQVVRNASYNRNNRITQVSRLFLSDSIYATDIMVTVVVKGVELPARLVEKLVTEYFLEQRNTTESYHLEIDDQEIRALQPAKSLTNSIAISRPPSMS